LDNPILKSKNVKARPNTTSDFYPEAKLKMKKSTITNDNTENQNLETRFKSYDLSKNYEKNKIKDDNAKIEIGLTKFKLNPSPFKRREKSIDELILHLQKQIEDIEFIDQNSSSQQPFKHKKKISKKKQSKKSYHSHSPEAKLKPNKNLDDNLLMKVVKNPEKFTKKQILQIFLESLQGSSGLDKKKIIKKKNIVTLDSKLRSSADMKKNNQNENEAQVFDFVPSAPTKTIQAQDKNRPSSSVSDDFLWVKPSAGSNSFIFKQKAQNVQATIQPKTSKKKQLKSHLTKKVSLFVFFNQDVFLFL
jgi:hypothetical protein